jgi:predicted deacylase
MRVEQLGTGAPDVAIVGGIHGDEPCGVRAIERLLAEAPAVERPVKLVVANEEALERGVRYIDADLNRDFDPDDGRDAHEYDLAGRLADEVEGCLVLSIHSTQSFADPFGFVTDLESPAAAVCSSLPLVALCVPDFEEARALGTRANLIDVEAGLQGTDEAAENAYQVSRAFLTATGVLPGETTRRDLPLYQGTHTLEKPPAEEYEVFAENFTLVEAGEVYAAADGEALVAETPFYPIMLSPRGYRDVFGFAGEHLGTFAAPSKVD